MNRARAAISFIHTNLMSNHPRLQGKLSNLNNFNISVEVEGVHKLVMSTFFFFFE